MLYNGHTKGVVQGTIDTLQIAKKSSVHKCFRKYISILTKVQKSAEVF